MEADDLPDGWCAPNGTWFVVQQPPPTSLPDFMAKLVRLGCEGEPSYLPVFTSQSKTGDFIVKNLLNAVPMAAQDEQHLGLILESTMRLGVPDLSFDTENPDEPDRLPIRIAVSILYRTFGPKPQS